MSASKQETEGNYDSDDSIEHEKRSDTATSPVSILKKSNSSYNSSQEEYAIPLFSSSSEPGTPQKGIFIQ